MISPDLVFLFDVDNTLVDNDRVQDDRRKHLERESGPENRDRYWAILNSCAPNWVMQTISALFSATGWEPRTHNLPFISTLTTLEEILDVIAKGMVPPTSVDL